MLKQKKKKNEKRIYLFLLMLVVTICGLCYTESSKKEAFVFGKEQQKKGTPMFLHRVEKVESIQIELEGAVVSPGIYVLTNADTIGDAVEKGGGFTENADTQKLNLLDGIFDGELISIPKKGEEEKPFVSYSPMLFYTRFSYEDEGKPNFALTEKININKAESRELQLLPGVGKKLAENILLYRETNGKFETIEDIKNVPKIGDKIYEELKDKIMVD